MTIHNFKDTNFKGADYNPMRDMSRMADGMAMVFAVMKDAPQRWFTLEELAELSGVPQSSIGSYLSYMRRDYNYEVPKDYVRDGLYRYKLGVKGGVTEPKARKAKVKPTDILQIEKQHGEFKKALTHIRAITNDIEIYSLCDKLIGDR